MLYVASYREPSVSVYDIEAKSLIQNIDLRYCPNSSIQKFYFNQKTNTLYFLVHGTQKENPRGCDSGGYSTIRILNGSNFEIIPKLTNSTNVHSLLFNSEKNSIYALPNFESDIIVIDDQKNIITDRISLDKTIDYENAYDEKSNQIFGHYNGTISIVDLNNPSVIQTIQIPNYEDQQIRLISGNGELFIISDKYYSGEFSSKNGFLTILNIEEEIFSEKIKVGQRPLYNIFDHELDLLYIVNSQSESISVVNTSDGHVINSVESFRFEIVSSIITLTTIIMLAIIIKNRTSNNRSWLIGGLFSVFGVYIPWSYQFFLRLESSAYIPFFNTSIPIWPFTVAFPLSFSIVYYIFLFTRFERIRYMVSEAYYFPKRMIIEIFYDDSHIGKIAFVIFAMITSFLTYEMVQHITLQEFFNSLPASEILAAITIPEKIDESPASSFFGESPLLRIFLAGIGGIWLIILRRFWNLEWNKILKFRESEPQTHTIKEPKMKFRGSRSLVVFLYFAFFFYLTILTSSTEVEEYSQDWMHSPAYYSIIHFTFFIIPTTLVLLFVERIVFNAFSREKNREI